MLTDKIFEIFYCSQTSSLYLQSIYSIKKIKITLLFWIFTEYKQNFYFILGDFFYQEVTNVLSALNV